MVLFAGLLALGAPPQHGMARAQPPAAGARLAVPARTGAASLAPAAGGWALAISCRGGAPSASSPAKRTMTAHLRLADMSFYLPGRRRWIPECSARSIRPGGLIGVAAFIRSAQALGDSS